MMLIPIHHGKSKHFFRPVPGQTRFYGLVLAPSGSRVVWSEGGQVLAVPTSTGIIRLSAADVAEQATVGGCRLRWITEVPRAWQNVKGAAS